MKIKLDQNFSHYLREVLVAHKHDVDTVFDEALSGATDAEVLKSASSQDRILFTIQGS